MDPWLIMIVAVVGLMFAASLIKTVLGTAVRYLMFVAFAAIIYQQQIGATDFAWLDIEIGQQLAIIAGITLLATSVVVLGVFHRSRLKIILWPLVGLAMTFGVTALWTQ